MSSILTLEVFTLCYNMVLSRVETSKGGILAGQELRGRGVLRRHETKPSRRGLRNLGDLQDHPNTPAIDNPLFCTALNYCRRESIF